MAWDRFSRARIGKLIHHACRNAHARRSLAAAFPVLFYDAYKRPLALPPGLHLGGVTCYHPRPFPVRPIYSLINFRPRLVSYVFQSPLTRYRLSVDAEPNLLVHLVGGFGRDLDAARSHLRTK